MHNLRLLPTVILLVLALVACDRTPDVAFEHGVASGDPLQNAVILWTHVTPLDDDDLSATIPVRWVVAGDGALENIVAEGETSASIESNFTVKVDAQGLAPGQSYYYGFSVGDQTSPIGRTKTLPAANTARVKLAVVSCSNYPAGYFNVYRAVAQRDDIDTVVHLGDYFYEYGADGFGSEAGKALGRISDPAHEIVSLDDYRTRHAQYRSDPDLQALTARHPMIAVWDDHESANNSYSQGAQNHDESEGDWEVRKAAAVRAYHEWLPIRAPDPERPERTYRSFQYGDLATLIMLDTRLIGRDKQIDYATDLPELSLPFDFSDPLNPVPLLEDGETAAWPEDPEDKVLLVPTPFDVTGDEPVRITDYKRIVALDRNDMPEGVAFLPDVERFKDEILADPDRSIMGGAQEAWLKDQLAASKAANTPWQILGQQLIVGELIGPDLSGIALPADKMTDFHRYILKQIAFAHQNDLPFNLDAWDGYPGSRARLAADIRAQANNVVILSGDTHNGWAFNLREKAAEQPFAVEFATPGVTSPGMEAFFPVDPVPLAEKIFERNRELVYLNGKDRGFLVLTLTPDRATSAWHYVDTVTSREFTTHCEKALSVGATDWPGVDWLEDAACD